MLPTLTENQAAAPAAQVDENTPALEQNAPELAVPVVDDVVTATQVVAQPAGEKMYPSLYDTLPTTVAAIAIGISIIGGIQWIVRRIFSTEKMEHKALTQFVTAMFALIVGVWIADKLIAGPSTELISPEESSQLLTFIKDITLMVFSYYFGTKAQVPSDVPDNSSEVSNG
jgi:Na+-transporting NADH:ubiquinone oxidoreductase subunit NqrE